MKHLFEIEYDDTMSDVQGDVSKILKEFIKKLKEEIPNLIYIEQPISEIIGTIDKLAGSRLT